MPKLTDQQIVEALIQNDHEDVAGQVAQALDVEVDRPAGSDRAGEPMNRAIRNAAGR